MKDQVVELKVAKELPEGFESEHIWFSYHNDVGAVKWDVAHRLEDIYGDVIRVYQAPTTDEMWSLLPKEINRDGKEYWLCILPDTIRYISFPCINQLISFPHSGNWTNIATALARLYMWLVENGYVPTHP
jgi:hypothetical protein